MSAVYTSATRPSTLARVWAFLVRVARLELGIYESIGRVIAIWGLTWTIGFLCAQFVRPTQWGRRESSSVKG